MKRLVMLALLFGFMASNAYTQSISLYSSISIPDIPLSGWTDTMKNIPDHIYSRKANDVSYSFGVNYFVSNTQHITFEIELFNTTAFLMYDCREEWCAAASQDLIVPYKWDINSIPLNLGYEYLYTSINRYLIPSVNLGISYSFVRISESLGNLELKRDRSNAMGAYGALGIKSEASKRIYLRSQIRYSYVRDVQYTTSTDISLNTNLSGLTYGIGLGIKI